MNIDENKWADIIGETKAGIDRWNESAAKHGKRDTFRFSTQKNDRYEIILTEHDDSYSLEARALAREIATGEIRSTKVVRKKGRIIGFQTKTPDPKGWKSLADKPADEIIKKLGLTDFLMFIGSSVTEIRSTKDEGGGAS